MSISRSTAKSSCAGALSPEYALLGFLAQQPAHGYDLHRCLVDELGQVWHISLSQTYNILTRLEEQGYISARVLAQEKLPARRQFHLTASGRRRFNEWLHTPTGCSVRAIRVEFTTRLYFARTLGADVARDLIAAQSAEVQAGLLRLRATLADLPADQTFNHLGLSLRIRQLTSIFDWLAECHIALGLDK